MRVLAAEDRVDLDHLALERQRVEIVRDADEVDLRRQQIAGVIPVSVGEQAQLPAREDLRDLVLHLGESGHAGEGVLRLDAGRDRCRLRRVSLGGAHDVHEVECLQVVEVDDVVLDHLAAENHVADQVGLVRDGVLQCVLDRPDGGDGVHGGAHPADPLEERPDITRVAVLDHELDALELRRLGPGLVDLAVSHGELDAQVTFDPGHRIDDDLGAHEFSPSGVVAAPSVDAWSTGGCWSVGGGTSWVVTSPRSGRLTLSAARASRRSHTAVAVA